MYRLLLQAPPDDNDTADYDDIMEEDGNLFPPDLFTAEQLRQGAVLLYILGILTMMVGLATVTREFLVPALDVMREKLGASHDVAGAIIIPLVLAIPSLVTSIIGVFLATSVETVSAASTVGSTVFHVTGLLGLCALCRAAVVTMNWWPVLRNFSAFIIIQTICTIFFLDNVIHPWEAGVLLCLFLVYIVLMVLNTSIQNGFYNCCCAPQEQGTAEDNYESKPLSLSPPSGSVRAMLTYIFMFPVHLPLWLTLPDSRKETSRPLFPLTLLGCLVWLGAMTWCVVWWATVTGTTLGIPPTVMGLTVLALATALPTIVTGVSLTRRGQADAVLSLAMGSNMVSLTLTTPLPWILYALVYGEDVLVDTAGLGCSLTLLMIMMLLSFLAIIIFRRKLSRGLGVTLIILYLMFVAVALSLQFQIIVCPI